MKIKSFWPGSMRRIFFKTFLVTGTAIFLIILSFVILAQSRVSYLRIEGVREQVRESRLRLEGHQEMILKLAVASEGRQGIASYSARILAYEDSLSRNEHKTLIWHFDVLLWRTILDTFFSSEEIFLLWCSISPFKDKRGIWNASEYYYNKPLQELGTRELAALVAMVRSPGRFEPGTRDSEERIRELLEIIEDQKKVEVEVETAN